MCKNRPLVPRSNIAGSWGGGGGVKMARHLHEKSSHARTAGHSLHFQNAGKLVQYAAPEPVRAGCVRDAATQVKHVWLFTSRVTGQPYPRGSWGPVVRRVGDDKWLVVRGNGGGWGRDTSCSRRGVTHCRRSGSACPTALTPVRAVLATAITTAVDWFREMEPLTVHPTGGGDSAGPRTPTTPAPPPPPS